MAAKGGKSWGTEMKNTENERRTSPYRVKRERISMELTFQLKAEGWRAKKPEKVIPDKGNRACKVPEKGKTLAFIRKGKKYILLSWWTQFQVSLTSRHSATLPLQKGRMSV